MTAGDDLADLDAAESPDPLFVFFGDDHAVRVGNIKVFACIDQILIGVIEILFADI